jgi:tRNA G18 (ribose-2'-O)-methylase SpoU
MPPLTLTDGDHLDSLNHPLADPLQRLLTRAGRLELGYILIDDEENILAAQSAGLALSALVTTDDLEPSPALVEALPETTARLRLAKRTGKKIFGNERVSRIFALAPTPAPTPLAALAEIPQDIVVLEDVSLMGNIGAMIRTTLALGLGGMVLLGGDDTDLYDRRLIRSSRGGIFGLPVVCASQHELLAFVGEYGLELVVTSPHAPNPVEELSTLPTRLALAFGHEKTGCSPKLIEAAQRQVRIPITGAVESLNISVAAGITLYSRHTSNGVG